MEVAHQRHPTVGDDAGLQLRRTTPAQRTGPGSRTGAPAVFCSGQWFKPDFPAGVVQAPSQFQILPEAEKAFSPRTALFHHRYQGFTPEHSQGPTRGQDRTRFRPLRPQSLSIPTILNLQRASLQHLARTVYRHSVRAHQQRRHTAHPGVGLHHGDASLKTCLFHPNVGVHEGDILCLVLNERITPVAAPGKTGVLVERHHLDLFPTNTLSHSHRIISGGVVDDDDRANDFLPFQCGKTAS